MNIFAYFTPNYFSSSSDDIINTWKDWRFVETRAKCLSWQKIGLATTAPVIPSILFYFFKYQAGKDFFFKSDFSQDVSLVPMTEYIFANKTFTTPLAIIFVRNMSYDPKLLISSFKPFTCSVKFVTTNVRAFYSIVAEYSCFYSHLEW